MPSILDADWPPRVEEDLQYPGSQNADADHHEESQSPLLPAEIPDSQPDTSTFDPDLPSEIPDSQEDPADLEFADEEFDDSASFHSEDTEIIPGGTVITPTRYPLHRPGICCNGRLPCEAPQYRVAEGEEEMDEATQPATQPFLDPRREGTTSHLGDQDESDIICVLLPTSPPAHLAVELTAKAAPQHILQNRAISQVNEDSTDPFQQVASTKQDNKSQGSKSESPQRDEPTQDSEGKEGAGPARDIALRFSSKVKSLCSGFVFGRHPLKCDLLLCEKRKDDDKNAMVSNKHFRIYLNHHGVLMLEDTSTNGTCVDTVLLQRDKGKTSNPDLQTKRTLTQGSSIELPTMSKTDRHTIRFSVRMLSRDDFAQEKYNQNLFTYISCIQQAERRDAVAAQAAADGKAPGTPPVPLDALKHGVRQDVTPNASILAAATGGYNHGMLWNGGEKYNVVGYIGKGAFAMVYKLSSKSSGEVYAVKQIEKRRFIKDGLLGHKVHYELNVMKKLSHPNIVRYVDHHETNPNLYIIMEYMSYGDHLTSYAVSGNALPEYVGMHVAYQILQALDYLHKRNITHRDIKPDNILMASEFPYVFKLSDFGLAKIVSNEDTFLKTFCGTLLYCAPEVYPAYQRVKAGLPPKRPRDQPRDETIPYKHSVDTWGLSAVLYHLLCGHPPFTGSAEDQGAVMLMNVMSTEIDWDRLRQAGVSDEGIEFLQRMLITDPSQRASDAELLDHIWIRHMNGPADVSGTDVEDQSRDLDASQLSLADDDGQQGTGHELDEMDDPRAPKRQRGWVPGGIWGQPVIDGAPRDLPPLPMAPPHNVRYPPSPQRLFGEIGTSALRSSGVLDSNAHAALQVGQPGSYSVSSMEEAAFLENAAVQAGQPGGYSVSSMEEPAGGNYEVDSVDVLMEGTHDQSSNASYINSRAGRTPSDDFGSYIDPAYVGNDHHRVNKDVTQQNLQSPPTLPGPTSAVFAPSLLGTEAMVGQLNMASSESGASTPVVGSKPTSPKSREISPALAGSKRSIKPSESLESDANTKRSKTSRAKSSPHKHHRSAEPSRHRSYTSKASGSDTRYDEGGQETFTFPQGNVSEDTQSQYQDRQKSASPAKGDSQMSSTAFDTQGSAEGSEQNTGLKVASRPPSSSSKTVLPSLGPAQASATKKAPSFTKPPFRFGNLVPTHGSVSTPRIKITQHMTTYGREPISDFVHPDPMDWRIAKNAIDIKMHYPGIEKDIEAGKTDWHLREDLTAIITTRTSRYIKINGVRLMMGQGCWLYGKLKTNDIISVFELPEGQAPKNEKEKEYLRLRCEFFVGASREPRAEGENFVVEKEEEKFFEKKMPERRSRAGTPTSQASLADSIEKGDHRGISASNTKEAKKGKEDRRGSHNSNAGAEKKSTQDSHGSPDNNGKKAKAQASHHDNKAKMSKHGSHASTGHGHNQSSNKKSKSNASATASNTGAL